MYRSLRTYKSHAKNGAQDQQVRKPDIARQRTRLGWEPPNGPDTAGRGSAPADDDTPDSSDQTRLSGFDGDGTDGADRSRDGEADR